MAPVVFKTEPNIFTIDFRLRANEKKTFSFSEKIPSDAPPSYSGGFVKETVLKKRRSTLARNRPICCCLKLRIVYQNFWQFEIIEENIDR